MASNDANDKFGNIPAVQAVPYQMEAMWTSRAEGQVREQKQVPRARVWLDVVGWAHGQARESEIGILDIDTGISNLH
jgi:hypothetical protein